MKTIILAGGYGSRISEYTNKIPKPMIPIGDFPILYHIMNHYSKYDFNDFIIALGYKGDIIKDYFLKFYTLKNDFTIDLANGKTQFHKSENLDWKVSLIDTGLNTMTGGRIKRLKEFTNNETFFLTYGDGVSDVNIKELLNFHKSHGKLVTLTAVRPNARFGELNLLKNRVVEFEEKPQLENGWINGGFFVIEPEALEYIEGDSTMFEREPLEKIAKEGELMAYFHKGFWQCMDTKRDHDYLEDLWKNDKAAW